ncbi:MAG: hypothetical protein H6729_11025 [Deltaproteobacteria bacterium]|nr:hypothetical protein [Deltaproteobacteria bacterium]
MRTEPAVLPLTPRVLRLAQQALGSDDDDALLRLLFRHHVPRPSPDPAGAGNAPGGDGAGVDVPEVDTPRAQPTRRIVSLSDVHVSAGRHPVTGRIDPLDQFLPDQEQQFLRFLMREWLGAAGVVDASEARILRFGDIPWHEPPSIDAIRASLKARPEANHALTLNLNGDILDFLQTTVDSAGVRYPDGLLPGLRAPRNTPANAIVQLNVMRRGHPEFFTALAIHLCLGHNIDFIPGNHDRALFNPLVWSGQLEVQGKTFHGLEGILKEEMRRLGASESGAREALGHLRRLPFAMYGDVYLDHGDHYDADNRTRAPLEELYKPTPMNQEMQAALGDHGVRLGPHDLIADQPSFAERWNRLEGLLDVFRAPRLASRMVWGYLLATLRDGYETSPEDDLARRIEDARRLPRAAPNIVDMVNAFGAPITDSRATSSAKPSRPSRPKAQCLSSRECRPTQTLHAESLASSRIAPSDVRHPQTSRGDEELPRSTSNSAQTISTTDTPTKPRLSRC